MTDDWANNHRRRVASWAEQGHAFAHRDILRAIEQLRTQVPQAHVELVHPDVYRQRYGCPLWSAQPDPAHVHNRDCAAR